MTSTIRTTITVAVGLWLLAGSPAFAARYDAHQSIPHETLIGTNAGHQLPLLSSSRDNSLPGSSATSVICPGAAQI